LIFFTDGYGTAPTNPPPYPVLWLLCKNGRAPANWGMVINL
jgi:predicted metal-dependent peptidase